jgi:hypothetical protein
MHKNKQHKNESMHDGANTEREREGERDVELFKSCLIFLP